MPYRPQFAYAPPPGDCRDEEFEYYFDKSTTPGLAVTLTPGATQNNIPLVLDKDAVFLCRGVKMGNPSTVLGVQLRDPYGNFLSDDYEPAADYSGFSGQGVEPGSPPRAIEPEIECPAGTNFILNLKDIDPLTPVLIDPANLSQGSGGDYRTYGRVFLFGGALYMVGWSLSAQICQVFQSLNNGASWAALDSANGAAANFSPGWVYDNVNTITVAYIKSGVAPAPAFLKTFNLLTGTWGAEISGVNQPSITNPVCLFVRPDASVVVLDVVGLPGLAKSGMTAYVYTPGTNTWTNGIDVGAGMLPLPAYNGTKTTAADFSSYQEANGTIGFFWHLIGINNGPPIWTNRCFYQQFLPNNTLGSFFDFPGQGTSPQDLIVNTGSPLGAPVLIPGTNKIVLPVSRTIPTQTSHAYPTLYIGTPISAPVWTELKTTAGIDAAVQGSSPPATINGGLLVLAPLFAFFDGGRIVVSWSISDPAGITPFAGIRVAQTNNLTDPTQGWIDSTVFQLATDAPAFVADWSTIWPEISNFTISNGEMLLAVDGVPIGGGNEARFFLGFIPLPESQQIAITLRGVKRYPGVRQFSSCAVV